MRVNRESFLNELHNVKPGLSKSDLIEQSTCIIFRAGFLQTFDGEVACKIKTCVGKGITGAVPGEPMMKHLEKWTEDEIDVEAEDDEFVLIGKGQRAGIRMEKTILLRTSIIEPPKTWKKLAPDFLEAVETVCRCAGDNPEVFLLTCIHLHPDWLEACDRNQLIRWSMATKFTKSWLITAADLKEISPLGVTEFSETPKWLHFRAPNGLEMSFRVIPDAYRDMESLLRMKGKPATLPKGLAEAANKASIASQENADFNRVMVTVKSGKLRVKGQGVLSWYSQTRPIEYDGPPLEFMVSPKLLADFTTHNTECSLSEERLKIKTDKYVYIASLNKVQVKP